MGSWYSVFSERLEISSETCTNSNLIVIRLIVTSYVVNFNADRVFVCSNSSSFRKPPQIIIKPEHIPDFERWLCINRTEQKRSKAVKAAPWVCLGPKDIRAVFLPNNLLLSLFRARRKSPHLNDLQFNFLCKHVPGPAADGDILLPRPTFRTCLLDVRSDY